MPTPPTALAGPPTPLVSRYGHLARWSPFGINSLGLGYYQARRRKDVWGDADLISPLRRRSWGSLYGECLEDIRTALAITGWEVYPMVAACLVADDVTPLVIGRWL